jgi:hypothetical protein
MRGSFCHATSALRLGTQTTHQLDQCSDQGTSSKRGEEKLPNSENSTDLEAVTVNGASSNSDLINHLPHPRTSNHTMFQHHLRCNSTHTRSTPQAAAFSFLPFDKLPIKTTPATNSLSNRIELESHHFINVPVSIRIMVFKISTYMV